MNVFVRYIRFNRAFLIPFLLYMVFLLPVFFCYSKPAIHLFLNRYHCGCADFFFEYITWLGDGIIAVFLAPVFFVFFSLRKGAVILLGTTLAGLTAQFFKRILFPEIVRPFALFNELPDFHFVEGVAMHSAYSFPSGHAATIFALCLILSGFTVSKSTKFILFMVALLVAYSRVYLSQHFLIDIYAGSIIGIVSAFLSFYLFSKLHAPWIDNSLLKLSKK